MLPLSQEPGTDKDGVLPGAGVPESQTGCEGDSPRLADLSHLPSQGRELLEGLAEPEMLQFLRDMTFSLSDVSNGEAAERAEELGLIERITPEKRNEEKLFAAREAGIKTETLPELKKLKNELDGRKNQLQEKTETLRALHLSVKGKFFSWPATKRDRAEKLEMGWNQIDELRKRSEAIGIAVAALEKPEVSGLARAPAKNTEIGEARLTRFGADILKVMGVIETESAADSRASASKPLPGLLEVAFGSPEDMLEEELSPAQVKERITQALEDQDPATAARVLKNHQEDLTGADIESFLQSIAREGLKANAAFVYTELPRLFVDLMETFDSEPAVVLNEIMTLEQKHAPDEPGKFVAGVLSSIHEGETPDRGVELCCEVIDGLDSDWSEDLSRFILAARDQLSLNSLAVVIEHSIKLDSDQHQFGSCVPAFVENIDLLCQDKRVEYAELITERYCEDEVEEAFEAALNLLGEIRDRLHSDTRGKLSALILSRILNSEMALEDLHGSEKLADSIKEIPQPELERLVMEAESDKKALLKLAAPHLEKSVFDREAGEYIEELTEEGDVSDAEELYFEFAQFLSPDKKLQLEVHLCESNLTSAEDEIPDLSDMLAFLVSREKLQNASPEPVIQALLEKTTEAPYLVAAILQEYASALKEGALTVSSQQIAETIAELQDSEDYEALFELWEVLKDNMPNAQLSDHVECAAELVQHKFEQEGDDVVEFIESHKDIFGEQYTGFLEEVIKRVWEHEESSDQTLGLLKKLDLTDEVRGKLVGLIGD